MTGYEAPPTPPSNNSGSGGDSGGGGGKSRRGVDVLAVLFLGAAAIVAIAGLAYRVVFTPDSDAAVSALSMIATGAMGALGAILAQGINGGTKRDQGNDNNQGGSP